MAIPNLSPHITINTDSSAGKAVASRPGLDEKTKHVQVRFLYIQDIVQRGEMTDANIPTTHNAADVLTKHLPSTTIQSHLDRLCLQTTQSTVGTLRGVATSTKLTIGMSTTNNEQPNPAAEARAIRTTQLTQYRRRRNVTPQRNANNRLAERNNATTMILEPRQLTITIPASSADNGNGALWLDHSIATWMSTSTEWHMNSEHLQCDRNAQYKEAL
eukprot:537174-Amphidinium_carterae.2